MAGAVLRQVQGLPTDFRTYVDNLPGQSRAQQTHFNSEVARVEGDLTASFQARGREIDEGIAESTERIKGGYAEVARAYQDAESAYELGDITLPEFRGRIQALGRQEGRLQEQKEALDVLIALQEERAGVDPVVYQERIYRNLPNLPRPTFNLFPKKSGPDFSSPI